MKNIKILHLEDCLEDSELILSEIESKDYAIDYTRVVNEKDFVRQLETNTFDIVLADNNLPTYDGISALRLCNEKYPDYPFVFVSGTLGEEIAIDMLKEGASDYILKNNLMRLVPAIERAIEEEELKQQKIISEKRYKEIVNTAADVIFTLDKKSCLITSLNRSFEKLTGFLVDDYIGKQFTGLLNEDDAKIFLSVYETIIKEKTTKTVIVKARTVKEDHKFIEITAQPLFDKDKLTGILCIARDITEAILAEEKIKELSTAVEQSPVSVVLTDLKGDIEYVNPKFTEVTGYRPEEVIGKNPRILKSGETDSVIYKQLWDTITAGGVWRGELSNRKKNGELYWESASISPIKNTDGVITHFIGVKEDITEKKIKETELIEAKEKAEESNRLKSCFLANMSHELRTPMIAILGFTEILSDIVEDKEIKEYVDLIYEGGERLMETLNLILNLSLIESEKLTLNPSKLDIIKEMNETINFFKPAAGKKNLFLKAETEFDSLNANLDSGVLRQVMNNLLINAIKFTEKGGITICINKETKYEKSFASICVNDTGIGIPEDKQEIIWEEYRQVSEGLNRTFEGTGLGLTITKKFVSKLGGEIFLERSEVGKGSTFTVLLPLDNGVEKKQDTVNVDKKSVIPQIHNSGPAADENLHKILYVDDDPRSIEVVKIFLKGLCDIDSAMNSDECISKVECNKYSAILMDINLRQGRDGLQTAGLVRKIPGYANIPIIANTAYTMVGDKEEFLSKGCTHYISKPFSSVELKKLIKTVLAESQ